MAKGWMLQKRRWQVRELRNPDRWRPELTGPYGDLLETLPWDWWATFTFAGWIHPDQARQRYERWSVELADETGLQMVHARALEWQLRGVVHFHALIWGVKRRTRRKAWEERWREIGDGWAMLRPYERSRGARYYLGKYTVKGGEVDILRFGESAWQPDDVRITRT